MEYSPGPTIAVGNTTLLVLKGERFTVRRAGEGFNRLPQGESRERHLVRVELAESQPPGFPEMSYGLRIESQQSRAYDISRQRISARDREAGLDGMTSKRPGTDHRGMADGDREMDGNRFAMAAIKECMSAKKAFLCRCVDRGCP